ncbi:MAG TPA: molybdopterin cofactor-binding domain-containing protein [Kofleriaceae bacterium]|nr:molybdopterin cofactor-binding domain-containing protein [Kofleriaceae bacterium]
MPRSIGPVRITRRAFLVGLELSLGGLALGVFPRLADADEPSGRAGPGPRPASDAEQQATGGLDPNVLVHIAADGTTTIVCHRSEMGQGVRSSIPMLIADELGADPARVIVRQADGDAKYGDQNTDGSSSIRKFYEQLRQAGAAARMMLVAAAAQQWKVKPETCTTRMHEVVHPATKRTLGFGALVPAAAKLAVPKPAEIKLRPDKELTHVAQATPPLLDGRAIVDGSAKYGADIQLPGLVVAVIARPPVVGGKVARYDASAALKVPGVRRVIAMPVPKPPYHFQPWGGIAVVADHTWAALKGRAALRITWDHGEHASYDSAAYRDELLASVRAPGVVAREVGNVEAAFGKAARTVEAEYLVPHLAHLAMEPPAAVARFANGRAEVWTSTQNPQDARTEVARVLGVDEAHVTVHVTLLGGGFGRKSKADFPSEAAFLAREVGAPVRVQWTRDDDIQHDYYNAVNAQRLRAALDGRGKVTAWHHRTAFTPISSTFAAGVDTPKADDLQQGVLDLALAVPNVRAEACKAPVHARIGWYRSVYNIFHAFAIGSFVDELAAARGSDPRDTWLELLGPPRQLSLADLGIAKLPNYGESLKRHPVDAGRLRRVIERVTDAAHWSERKRNGRALGLAAHRSFVSYTAVVLSVVPDKQRKLRIDEAWLAIDAGTVVNQDRVHAQLEGSLAMGISNALFGGVTMKGGAVEQTNFRDARIARNIHVPSRIHTDIVPSHAPPGGVGEPGVPPVGPALANAIFALTGQRIREIPLARALGI